MKVEYQSNLENNLIMKLELQLKEVPELIKPKIPGYVRNLNASGNYLKFDIRVEMPGPIPNVYIPCKAKFARYYNSCTYVELSTDINPIVNIAASKVLKLIAQAASQLGRSIEDTSFSLSGNELKISKKEFKGLEIQHIDVNAGTVIIDAYPSNRKSHAKSQSSIKFTEYIAGGEVIHSFDEYKNLESHAKEAIKIAYKKNYYKFYPSGNRVTIGELQNSFALLTKSWNPL
jgi:hypothetical protein